MPVFWNCSNPASRSTNSGFGMSDPNAMIAAFAAWVHHTYTFRETNSLRSDGKRADRDDLPANTIGRDEANLQ